MLENFRKLSMITLALATFSGVAFAQETTEPADTTAPAATDGATAEGLALGEAVDGDSEIGKSYTKEEHGDWDVRCIRTADGNDPCQLYQLLLDQNDNSVAEISMFALPEGQQAVAGATVGVPLETLLTQQLTLAIDSGQARRYPFTWCSPAGCFARIGLTAADIAAFKRGVKGTMTIVPVAAPDQKVVLDVSLSGFTAGFDAVSALNK